MLSLEKKASEKLCLTCKKVYEPTLPCSPEEYPHCAFCNFKTSQKLINLPKIKYRSEKNKKSEEKKPEEKLVKKKKIIYFPNNVRGTWSQRY